jgi:hypothetical protein
MKNIEEKDFLSGKSIVVRNEKQADFIFSLARELGYSWRNVVTSRSADTNFYNKREYDFTDDFVYCFDYRDEERKVLSYFSSCFLATSSSLQNGKSLVMIEAEELIDLNLKEVELLIRLNY